MGESRYYTAHGVWPHGGPDRTDVQNGMTSAPDMSAYAAGPQGQWSGYDAAMTRGRAPNPAQDTRNGPHPSHGAGLSDGFYHAPYPPAATPDAYAPAGWDGQLPPQTYAAHPARAGGAPPAQARYDEPPHGYAHAAPVPPARPSAVPPVSMARLLRGFGAVTSLVLLIGGGIWAWQMMQRDVSGVPVVRALEGPLRVAPEDPGGMQAAHQGLSVNELAADGATGVPDEIVLAPEPLDLDQELSRPARDNAADAGPETLIEVGLPMAGADPAEDPETAQKALGFVTPNRSAVTRSPRPAPRQTPAPGQQAASRDTAAQDADTALAAAVANSVAADLSREGGIDVDPSSIGPGTRLVQLGAFDSSAEARAAWDALAQRFKPLLDDRGRVIEAAHSGGSVFYRLRAHGFSDERDARRFCAALIDQRLDCIPVLIR